jgi:HK97 family phage prohead protease
MTTTMQTPPREDLCRSVPFDLVRADGEEGDGLTIEGYGAVFNAVTLIDSWEGTFEETIAPGAFRKSLRERRPKMQFDHGRHPMLGSLPLGRWDVAEEDYHGLHVVGRLSDNWLVQPFRDAIRDEGVEGMSFRFSVVREEWRDAAGKVIRDSAELAELLYNPGDRGMLRRTLKEVKVPEVGPVTWPAYEATSVGVRSQVITIDLGRLTEPDTRAELARAVFLADAANSPTEEDDAPRSNQEPPGEHPSPEDAPLADRSSPGEHPSAPPQKKANPARAFATHARGYLLSMERN